MSNSRIFYGLQNVQISTDDTAGNLQTIRGVQSVGTSSTTNIETFSAFGSIAATSILQDMDLEITMEVGVGSWATALSQIGYSSFTSSFFDTTKKVRITYDLDGTLKYVELDAILTSYSAQMGTDGPVTESLTFQNAGNAGFGAATELSTTGLPESPSQLDLCGVYTRPDFTSFDRNTRSDCCATTAPTSSTVSNAISWSISMDASNEKVSVLGQSMPFGKFASFPVETSMEVEMHMDPSTSILDFNSGSLTGSSLNDVCYDPTVIVGGASSATGRSWNLSRARQSGQSRSGGDVGGGNVSVTESYTGYNDLAHDADLSS